MSVQRRSSSPLSSASPSPLQAPVLNTDQSLASLHLGPPAEELEQHDEGDIGGSSPTTLTEPLTDSELTEDDDDGDGDDGDDAEDDDQADANLDDDAELTKDTDDEVPTGASHPGQPPRKRESSDHSQLSPSPSLTPPPPSDPPRSDALPSSPRGVDDDNEELDPAEEDLSEDDATPSGHGAPLQAGHAAESDAAVEAETGRDEEDEEDGDGDGDVTMRADMDVDADEEAAEEIIPEEPEAAVDPEADAQDEDDDEHEETDANDSNAAVPMRPGHSSHAPPPSAAAMRAFLALEVKFAALRDRLYVERLEEAAREEEMILNGTHPALIQLNKTLESRRERLHEVAARRYEETVTDLGRWRDVEKSISWSTWTDQRDRMQWEEFEHTWSKRRRLAREKNELETPKAPRPIPRVGKAPKLQSWSTGAAPLRLTAEEGLQDLQLMDITRQQQQQQLLQQQQQQQQQQAASRHASPAMYSSYNGPPSYAYQAAQQQASYLQSETQEQNRQSQFGGAGRQQVRPVRAAGPSYGEGLNSSIARPSQASNPSSLPRTDPFGLGRREPVSTTSNGDAKRSNGHSRHNSNALGTLATPSFDSKATPTSGSDRPNASARFPGLADYLSGSATPPQNTFQHHLLSSTNSSGVKASLTGSQSGSASPGSALGSTLGRPSFSQVPQPQTASAQRS